MTRSGVSTLSLRGSEFSVDSLLKADTALENAFVLAVSFLVDDLLV